MEAAFLSTFEREREREVTSKGNCPHLHCLRLDQLGSMHHTTNLFTDFFKYSLLGISFTNRLHSLVNQKLCGSDLTQFIPYSDIAMTDTSLLPSKVKGEDYAIQSVGNLSQVSAKVPKGSWERCALM